MYKQDRVNRDFYLLSERSSLDRAGLSLHLNYGDANFNSRSAKFYCAETEFIVDAALIDYLEAELFSGMKAGELVFKAAKTGHFSAWIRTGIDSFIRDLFREFYPPGTQLENATPPYGYAVNEIVEFKRFLLDCGNGKHLESSTLDSQSAGNLLELFKEKRKQTWTIELGTTIWII